MRRAALAAVLCAAIVAVAARAAPAPPGSVQASVVANPLDVSLALPATIVAVGTTVSATATVRDLGSTPLASVSLNLAVDVQLAVAGGPTRTVATVPGNGTAQPSWQVCGLAPGAYVVQATATSGVFTASSAAQLLTVTTGSGQCPKDASAALPAGGTISTDREGDGATRASPVEIAVTTPVAGRVSIAETAAAVPSTAFSFLGQQVQITAPVATVATPLRLDFRLDSSFGASPATMQVFRNGVQVLPCAGGGAVPDPCVSSRSQLGGGDVELVVLTSAASIWTFGTPLHARGMAAGVLTTSNRHLTAFLVGCDGTTVAGALAYDAFASTKATAFTVTGRKAWLAGVGTDGRPFLAYLEDNGPVGHDDVFRLWVAGAELTTDGRLAKGDVTVT